MPALSAPSAKILTLRFSIFFMFALALYDCQSFVCRRNLVVVMGRRRLAVGAIDEDGPAARSDAGLHVVSAVSNHIATREIDVEFLGAREQHAGSRLPAIAAIAVVVKANQNLVDGRQFTRDQVVDIVHRLFWHCPTRHVRLVRHNNQDETKILQSLELLAQSWIDLDILDPCRWVRLALANYRAVQHAIAIQKDRPRPHLAALAVPTADSHFV